MLAEVDLDRKDSAWVRASQCTPKPYVFGLGVGVGNRIGVGSRGQFTGFEHFLPMVGARIPVAVRGSGIGHQRHLAYRQLKL